MQYLNTAVAKQCIHVYALTHLNANNIGDVNCMHKLQLGLKIVIAFVCKEFKKYLTHFLLKEKWQ